MKIWNGRELIISLIEAIRYNVCLDVYMIKANSYN